jgi:hypothetical protein
VVGSPFGVTQDECGGPIEMEADNVEAITYFVHAVAVDSWSAKRNVE